jgi:hypothetical protein
VLNAHLLKWIPVEVAILPKESGRLDFVVSVGLINIPRCRMDTSVDLRIVRNVVCILIPVERVSVRNVETCIVSKKAMNQLGSAMNARNHLKSVLAVKSVSQICLVNVLTVTMMIVMFVMEFMTKTVVLKMSLVRSSECPKRI